MAPSAADGGLEDGRLGMWTNHLGRLRLEYGPAIVDRAFEFLQAGERPQGQNISTRTTDPTAAESDESFFGQVLSPDEEATPFEQWVAGFKYEVHDRRLSPGARMTDHRFTVGDRVRIDIPDQRNPDYDRLQGRHGEITRILEDDADDVTGDPRDTTLYRVELDDGTTTDLRWRDLRPS